MLVSHVHKKFYKSERFLKHLDLLNLKTSNSVYNKDLKECNRFAYA